MSRWDRGTAVLAGLLLGALLLPGGLDAQSAASASEDDGGYRVDGLRVLRPIPGAVTLPPEYRRALDAGTRTSAGAPGEGYWQQWTRYRLRARLDPESGVLRGEGTIRHENRSPDTLRVLWLHLHQNVHAEGVPRTRIQEITGGITLHSVIVDGEEAVEGPLRPSGEEEAAAEAGESSADSAVGPRYQVRGTLMPLRPAGAVAPGDTVRLDVEWSFEVPQRGIGARMGHSDREVYFIAHWYPRVAVYDDLGGWDAQPFLGGSEFYDGFGSYDVAVTVPNGWTAMGTGSLRNPDVVLTGETRERLERALGPGGEVVHVATAADREAGTVTAEAPTGWLTWRFRADSVRDFAWTASDVQNWDATRAVVPDRDGDGAEDTVAIHAFWRESAENWAEEAVYARHSIEHHSRFTGLPYPWPHMTSVEGAGIIGGGMEFPMMTLMGGYDERGADALYWVTAHELAHMWVPMTASTNEKRWAWLDEGTTTFNENEARTDYFPGTEPHRGERERYLEKARSGSETELMRHGDLYPEGDYGVASYAKPATLLQTLRHLLGEETFLEAYREFFDRWAFKHPTPWDLFATFEDVSGRELDWFWTSWYYETWTLDQAVVSVERRGGETVIRLEDRGRVPMPARIEVELADGSVLHRELPVEKWLDVPGGIRHREIRLAGSPDVRRVTLNPGGRFPDVDASNDEWVREAGGGG